MLVICNGAIKSGSTWLWVIMKKALSHKVIPPEYQTGNKWGRSKIDRSKLSNFLREVDYKKKNYVCKSHYDQQDTRALLLEHPNVFVLNIRRNLRDVIVSHYFHTVNIDGQKHSFHDYYWKRGRHMIGYLLKYHHLWKDTPGKILNLTYEKLLEDFENEIIKIKHFLEIRLSSWKIRRIKKTTHMQKMSKMWKELHKPQEERFFRKGTIGDWENHFTPEIDEDFDKVLEVSKERIHKNLHAKEKCDGQ